MTTEQALTKADMEPVHHDSLEVVGKHPPIGWHRIGVIVHNPCPNHVGLGNVPSIDWQASYPTIWPDTIGGSIPYAQRHEKTQEQLANVITKIDECIKELIAHRQRLSEYLTQPHQEEPKL